MPVATPVPTKSSGELLTSALWNTYVRDNLNKLLERQHRVLTVAQFNALTGLEDGDEAYVEVDAASEIQWHLRYKLSTTKWRVLGGPSLLAEVTTGESTTSATYAALATAGPSIALPLVGTYDVEVTAQIQCGGQGIPGFMSYDIGATAAVDADAATDSSSTGGAAAPGRSSSKERRKAGLTVVTLTSKYRSGSGGTSITYTGRSLKVTPVRIG